MVAILSIVLLILIVTIGIIIFKEGVVVIPPLSVGVLRNWITNGMKEITPGTKIFVPGLKYIFKVIGCQKRVLDPDVVTITTSDGQNAEVDYVLTLWPDFFQDDGTPNPSKTGHIVKLATSIESGSEIEVAKKHTDAAVQRMFGNVSSYQLLKGRKTIKVHCPDCGTLIKFSDERCTNTLCDQAQSHIKIPSEFYNRLSWSAGVALDDFLEQKYGLACFLEIQNVRYIGDLQKAARAETVGKMLGKGTKAQYKEEAEAMKNLFDTTNVSPNIGFVLIKLAEAMSGLFGSKK